MNLPVQTPGANRFKVFVSATSADDRTGIEPSLIPSMQRICELTAVGAIACRHGLLPDSWCWYIANMYAVCGLHL